MLRSAWVMGIVAAALAGIAGTTNAQSSGPDPERDDSALVHRYDDAFAALLDGDYDRAISDFLAVAAATRDLQRRAAATELARLAGALRERRTPHTGVASGTAGSAPPPVGGDREQEDSSDRSGRTEFVIATTLASLYSGIVLVNIFDLSDFRAAVSLTTLTAAAGFAGSFAAANHFRITTGEADAYTVGLLVGAGTGGLLFSPLGIENDNQAMSFVLGTMATGAATGLAIGRATRSTRAHATLSLTLAAAGVASAGLGLGAFGPDEMDEDTVLLAMAGGLDLGVVAGMIAASRIQWSYSRARLISLSTFLGGLTGLAVGAIAVGDPDARSDGRVISGASLAGLWAGFALSAHLTRGMSPDPRFQAGPTPPPLAVLPLARANAAGVMLAGRF
jgi:hypothetical protein